jgi:hypothetical protein
MVCCCNTAIAAETDAHTLHQSRLLQGCFAVVVALTGALCELSPSAFVTRALLFL